MSGKQSPSIKLLKNDRKNKPFIVRHFSPANFMVYYVIASKIRHTKKV
jgi:hypothetical protein